MTIIDDLCLFNPYEKLQNLIMRTIVRYILAGNLIESIEAIVNINAPLLWRIDFGTIRSNIGDNLIREIKVFRKLHCPNLVMFRVGNNFILDLG